MKDSGNDANPYSPPGSDRAQSSQPDDRPDSLRFALRGAFWSIVSSFPIAILYALVFRFPVPFAGYLSGWDAVVPAMIATLAYGIVFGGFVLLGILGAVSGWWISRTKGPMTRRRGFALGVASVSITAICLFVLAILDKIIGPW